MTYTTTQEQVINSLANKFYKDPEYIKRQLEQYFVGTPFDEAIDGIRDTLHDHWMDMEMDAWEGSEEYEGEDYE